MKIEWKKTKKKVIKDLDSFKKDKKINLNVEIEMESIDSRKKTVKKVSSRALLNEHEESPNDRPLELDDLKEKKQELINEKKTFKKEVGTY